ncbi:TPA: hypothetical protein JG855_004527 [Vibrio parahaemolyticus]|uniref:hypothetical protein n=2 Tax=Vibrio parahaemolyticus TaxID=670 RepID=UPI00112017B7|nr:hypothetical protein [Vibrio parahaemolyticus]EGQ9921552.1 hypothetical protein [Vibrio parahaemolyticus]MDF4357136.1 hypothetical protein [Vibrio parahaemolyticus]MDF4545589.1 hypothetical protein [Vibrio parahaemolyticus]MDG2580398.1 hypothetical protein [Vibrio parahaemolyticus]MDG2799646.1 hypothetical protein [Vibrio parahaemolyticus]
MKEEVNNMDNWLKFFDAFTTLLDVSIWPIAVLVLVFSFKKPLEKILLNLSKFKYGDFEASFDKDLRPVEETVKEVNEVVGDTADTIRDVYNYVLDNILRSAELSPRLAITDAWREVESNTIKLMLTYEYDPSSVQMSKVFRGIVHEQGYPWSIYEDYKRLMKLRNQVVHAGDFELTQNEAERYARTAIDLAVFIKKLSENAPNKAFKSDS